MGYYSKVMIRCREGAFNMLKQPCLNAGADHIAKCEEYDEYLIGFDWTKWYTDFAEVLDVIDVLDKLDTLWLDGCAMDGGDGDDSFAYKFIRLGEENEDVYERSNDSHIELWTMTTFGYTGDFEKIDMKGG